METIYERLCYNCGGPISSSRLRQGLPCTNCLNEDIVTLNHLNFKEKLKIVYKHLVEKGKAHGIITLMDIEEEIEEFTQFFRRITGYNLWSAQRTWTRRLLLNESFAIVAPTGVGKTTLLIVYSMYTALKGGKVYFIVPTNTLVDQVYRTFTKYSSNSNLTINIIAYNSRLPKNKRHEILRKIEEGEYDILITTANFLSRNYDLLSKTKFKLIVVDDVDAILRNSKNIERILSLLGFSQEIISEALKAIFLKIQAMKLKTMGKNDEYQRILEEIAEINDKIHLHKSMNNIGQLVLASATGRARGIKVKLFKELLGFDIGGISEYMRNILDAYMEYEDVYTQLKEIYNKLGPGGLIFVSKDKGVKLVKELYKVLQDSGVRCAKALAGSSFIDKLQRGDVDLLIGVASYYGVMVRGLDEPQRVRYAIFVGIPKHVITLEKALNSPWRIIQLALLLMDKGIEVIDRRSLNKLTQRLSSLKQSENLILRIALSKNEDLKGKLSEILNELKSLRVRVRNELCELLKNNEKIVSENFIVKNEGGVIKIIVPDIMTYIQASGRTSRLFKGHMTFGLSIIIVDDQDLFNVFINKMRRYFPRFNVLPFNSIDLNEVKERIRRTREDEVNDDFTPIKTALLVVESPVKAKTIARLFGKPAKRRIGRLVVYEVPGYVKVKDRDTMYLFLITASYGHLTDLTMSNIGFYGVIVDEDKYIPVYNTIKRCLKCGYQFTSNDYKCPRCGSTLINDSIDIIKALQRLASEVDEVYIATDPDIEGEKIAWDIYNIVAAYVNNVYRLDIYEITRNGVERAFANPRSLSNTLVKAQLVRRITDRWIGFSLSTHLWSIFGLNWLGAGRVQTPVLGWIIDRYRVWKSERGYKILLDLEDSIRISLFVKDKKQLENIVNQIDEGVIVEDLIFYEKNINPPPPYTTDELLRDASIRLGLTAGKAMKVAQELFEVGLITYHRTDSIRISSTGIGVAKNYICDKLRKCNLFAPRTWSDKGAHEAIRPTKPLDSEDLMKSIVNGEINIPIPLTRAHIKLYDLIFRRFIASQMKPTRVLMAKISLRVKGYGQIQLELPVKILDEGHMLLTRQRIYENVMSFKKGCVLKAKIYKILRASPISLYTYGDLVWLMKNKGLGRPSTYAKILESIRRHGYVIESKKRKYLIPTRIGIKVYEYLTSNFPELVSEDTTRRLEETLDLVEKGVKDYMEVLRSTYETVTSTLARVSGKEAYVPTSTTSIST